MSVVKKVTQMVNGRDLRNKIAVFDQHVYIMGVRSPGAAGQVRGIRLSDEEIQRFEELLVDGNERPVGFLGLRAV